MSHAWSMLHEAEFIDELGHHSVLGSAKRLQMLEGYQASLNKRKKMGALDREKLRARVECAIAAERRAKRIASGRED